MHPDTGTSRGNHFRDAGQRQLGHQVEEGGQLREFIGEFFLHHHKFRAARDENRQFILQVFIRGLRTVLFNDADPAQPFDHLLCVFKGHVVHFCQFRNGIGHTGLFEIQQKFDLFFVEDQIQHPVFRVTVVHFLSQFFDITVRDQSSQL